ncbi:hypothetical protein FRC20_006196 [Serendipita sp. 405]|nr:hypothetical protein FRC20_006196 [Serendipita sp. 405]
MSDMVANYTLENEFHHALFSLSTRAATEHELGLLHPEVYVTYFSAHVYTKQLLVITAGESVELFWKQRWNLSKSLFLINRYVGLFTTTANALQIFLYHPSSHLFLISLAMLLRVIALWNRSRLVKMIVISLFLVNILFYVVSAVYAYAKGDGWISLETSPFTGCLPLPDQRVPFYIIFITALIFETSIVFFTILKSYPLLAQKSIDRGMFRLSSVLFNDGVIYYSAVILSQAISLYASTISVETHPTVSIPIVSSAPAIVVTTVACNRLFLRLHDVILTREDEDEPVRGVANGSRKGAGTAIVSTRVSVFAPMGQSTGSNDGSGDGGARHHHSRTTNDVRFSSQLAMVDFDYHNYLREDLNSRNPMPTARKGGLPAPVGKDSRYHHRSSSERSYSEKIAMSDFQDGRREKPMFLA